MYDINDSVPSASSFESTGYPHVEAMGFLDGPAEMPVAPPLPPPTSPPASNRRNPSRA